MKELLLSVAIAILGFSGMNAQETYFGAKAGVNLANVTGDTEGADMRTAFHVGILSELMFGDKLAIQPEILYSSQGYKVEEEIMGRKHELNYNYSYINIPVMAKYYVTEGLNLQAGPQIGFLMSAKETESDTDIKDSLKSIDFGVNLGLGYKLANGIFFDARYNLGLSNINDLGDNKVHNGVIQISAGYSFN